MYKKVKNAAQEDAPGTDHLIVLFRNVKDKPLKIDFVTLTKNYFGTLKSRSYFPT